MMDLGRRKFFGLLLLGIGAKWLSPSVSQGACPKERTQNFRWRVPIAYLETVKANLRFEGTVTNEKDEKGVPLVFIFIGAALLPYLARAVLALRREIVYGGIIIDTTGNEIVIKNEKRLDAGVIILNTPSGTNIYERDEIEGPSELVTALLKGLKGK